MTDIGLYILNQENIPELAEKTGFDEIHFHAMLQHDRSFGLVSKIYLIPVVKKEGAE